MNRYDIAFEKTIAHEGGFVDHKNDTGGATNHGISLRFARSIKDMSLDKNDDGEIDVKDVRLFTVEDAKRVYKKHFWQALPYEQVEAKLFDIAVNMGKKQANKLLQRAIGVTADGVIGPVTVRVMLMIDENIIMKAFRVEIKDFYRRLVEARPQNKVFLKGWLDRADT